MIQCVIFDIDNTIYDYELNNKYALDEMFIYISLQIQIPVHTIATEYERINKTIKSSNNPSNKFNKMIYIKQLIERYDISISHVTAYVKIYNEAFYKNLTLYTDIEYVFQYLKEKGIKIGLLSNNIFSQQYDKLEYLQLLQYIDVIQTSDECGEEKPHLNMLQMIQQKLKIPYENMVFIGDNYEHDILPAKTYGLFPFWYRPSEPQPLSMEDKILNFSYYKDLLQFFHHYIDSVDEYLFLSKYFGQSILNVQGPGGNISIKPRTGLLLIKSSGCILGNTSYTEGYCLVDNQQCIEAVTRKIKGNPKELKILGHKIPSMETYFHSFMKKYTIHLHFTLSNIYFCSNKNGEPLAHFKYPNKIINYVSPGLELAIEIAKEYSTETDIYFLKNHGIIITGTTIAEVARYYEYIFNYFDNTKKYSNELICMSIQNIYRSNKSYVVVRPYKLTIEMFEPMIICFPDLAIFIQKITRIDSIIELVNQFANYDVIIYDGYVYLIAENMTKLYSMIEIIDSYYTIYSNCTATTLLSIDNVIQLQNMEEEKYRKL